MFVERARTGLVVIHSFTHAPTDAPASCEWWPLSCVAFTAYGSWEVRATRGRATVGTRTVLIGQGGADYDCRHGDGVDDRGVCVTYRREVEPAATLVLPLGARLHTLRRSLAAELRQAEPDGTMIDELCLDLLASTRAGADRIRRPSAATRAVVARVRGEADARYTDASLDLVAEAAVYGMSRTRLVHGFRALVGVTPHRYLVELRTAHAARLLAESRSPVTEICFASGFGSVARFHAAFRAAFGLAPTTYRARYAGS